MNLMMLGQSYPRYYNGYPYSMLGRSLTSAEQKTYQLYINSGYSPQEAKYMITGDPEDLQAVVMSDSEVAAIIKGDEPWWKTFGKKLD